MNIGSYRNIYQHFYMITLKFKHTFKIGYPYGLKLLSVYSFTHPPAGNRDLDLKFLDIKYPHYYFI